MLTTRLLLLASLALVVVEGCRPTFRCDPSTTATTVCHAHWACTFTLCSPGQTAGEGSTKSFFVRVASFLFFTSLAIKKTPPISLPLPPSPHIV